MSLPAVPAQQALPKQTMLHGDCHGGNNMLHKNKPEVCLLDWQMTGPGEPLRTTQNHGICPFWGEQ